MLGVSRTTLREALHGLAVWERSRSGTVRESLSPDKRRAQSSLQELGVALDEGCHRDLLEVRRMLLIEAATLAAERRTEEDLEAIEASLRASGTAIGAHRAPTHEGWASTWRSSAAAHNEVLIGVLRSFSRSILPSAQARIRPNGRLLGARSPRTRGNMRGDTRARSLPVRGEDASASQRRRRGVSTRWGNLIRGHANVRSDESPAIRVCSGATSNRALPRASRWLADPERCSAQATVQDEQPLVHVVHRCGLCDQVVEHRE